MPFIEEEELKQLKLNLEKEKSSNMKLLDFNDKKIKESEKYKKAKIRMTILTIVFAVLFYSVVTILFFKPNIVVNMLSSEAELKAVEMTGEVLKLQEQLVRNEFLVDSLKDVNKLLFRQNQSISSKKDTMRLRDTIRVEVVPDYYKQKKDFEDFLSGKKIYAVQLGIFRKLDITPISESFINFRGYKKDDYFVYSVGNFVSKEEAESFREKLVSMGLKNCFIVDYTLK